MSSHLRRWQRGALRLEGRRWVVRLRDEAAGEPGSKGRAEKRIEVGTLSALPSRTAARQAADELLRQLNPERFTSAKAATIAQFVHIYGADALPAMKPSARLSARSILRKHIAPFFGTRQLSEIAGRLSQQFVNELHRKGLRRKSVRNALAVLSRLLDLARQYGYQAYKLDIRAIKLPPDDIDTVPRCFTPAEARAVIDAAEPPWKLYFALLAYLGLRAGEALGLGWEHIDLELNLIKIRQSAVMGKLQTVKSRGSKADVPMPDALRTLLVVYRDQWTPNAAGLLFARSDGAPYWASTVRTRYLHPLLKRLGIAHGGLHAFRHGQATNLFAAGVTAPTVKEMMRHSKIETTLRYTHVVTADKRAAIEKAAALIDVSSTS